MRAGLRDWAERDPERMALIIDGQTQLSYGALEARSNQFAHLIRALGLQRGDHMAILLGNSPDAVALCWAASRTGVYLTPVPTRLAPRETAYIVHDCTAKLLIVAAEYGQAICDVDQAKVLSLGGAIHGVDLVEPLLADMPTTPISDESPGALMMYSSGTTGAPKGILRPLPGLDQSDQMPTFARDLLGLFGLSEHTRYLSTQPLYHAAALRFVLAVTAAGGLAVIMPKFDASRTLDLIDLHELTLSQWVPTMFNRLLALPDDRQSSFDGASHKSAIHGAAPCTPALKRAMIDWWGPILEEYYSGSEGVGLTAINSAEWSERPGSVGQAKKGTVHILGRDDTELPAGEIGRIFFSGISPFSYFGAPEKTASKTSSQGWQTFGDIGHLDADGYLFISDRADDMIISGGVNIYPQEIEAAIEESPFVAACGVVGFPDPEFEERPVAFVVLTADAPIDAGAQIDAHIAARLGRIKHPREVHFVSELPHSDTGKLLRRALHDLA